MVERGIPKGLMSMQAQKYSACIQVRLLVSPPGKYEKY